MTRRVKINGRFLAQRMTGVQRYAMETLLALDALLADRGVASGLELEVLAPRGAAAPPLRAIGFRHVGASQGHRWEQVDLLAAVRKSLLVSFGPTGPLLKRNQIVTMHDAAVEAVPDAYSWKFRAWYGLAMPLLARNALRVMTVSRFSQGELARCYGLDASAVGVSGEGWQHVRKIVADPTVLRTHGLRAKKYVLAVSSVTPHKNFAVIARAVQRLQQADVQVVVCGDNTQAIFGGIDLSGMDSVKFTGYVSDGQLRALYENAAMFVFPSRYEGFGLPPLEAMAFGCPVIASTGGAIPEVCGDAALYFEPSDDAQLSSLIARLMQSPEERAAWAEKGRARLAHHSWEAAASAHLQAIELALRGGAARARTAARLTRARS